MPLEHRQPTKFQVAFRMGTLFNYVGKNGLFDMENGC